MSNDTEQQMFSHSVKLKSLYLQAAMVTLITYDEFSQLCHLNVLDLSSNGLTNIAFDLSNLTSLHLLNLSNNFIYQLSSVVIDALNSMDNGTVDVQHNEFVCDCNSIGFLKWIKATTRVTIQDRDSHLCSYQGLGSVNLVGVDVNQLTAQCYATYIAIATVTFLAIVIIACLVVGYQYRWKMKTFLLRLAHYRRTQDNDNYPFDGFVVYSDEDRYWVHKTLLPMVEEEMKLKLCIHHRDFIPGHDIDEQIIRKINSSRKTLLILSTDFLRSDWCHYEMSVARNKLHAEGKDVVIPILLSELTGQ